MENVLMNVHICSMNKTDKSMMLNVFKAFKLNRGFVPCEADEAEMSYLVSYSESDVCSWLTVSGTHWHDNSYEAASDPLGLAQDFQMHSFRFNVDSNGSALIELGDMFGNSAGTCTIGDAVPGEYFTTHLRETVWQEFLKPLAAEETFKAALDGHYHSAEDTATTFAPLLHIGKDQLLTDAQFGIQSTDAVRLYFKAVPADAKKVTVKAAFKKIYGDALKPLGFVWAKTKEPCFIRVVNNELIHVIGIQDMKPNFIVPFGGVTTLYRAELMLNKSYRDNANWLPNVRQFWGWAHMDLDDAPDPRLGSKFHYLLRSPDSIQSTMFAALGETKRWILPMLSAVQSLQDFPGYFEKCYGTLLPFRTLPLKTKDDAVIRYLLGNPVSEFEQYLAEIETRKKAQETLQPNINSPENLQYLREREEARNDAIRQSVTAFEENPEVRQQTLDELERRRMANMEILHTYGVL